jgi:hypothetical protein
MSSVFKKQPSEKKTVSVSFSKELDDGDSISSVSVYKVYPNSMTVTGSVAGRKADLLLEDGYAGTSYLITVRVTTTGTLVYEKEAIVNVEDTI